MWKIELSEHARVTSFSSLRFTAASDQSVDAQVLSSLPRSNAEGVTLETPPLSLPLLDPSNNIILHGQHESQHTPHLEEAIVPANKAEPSAFLERGLAAFYVRIFDLLLHGNVPSVVSVRC